MCARHTKRQMRSVFQRGPTAQRIMSARFRFIFIEQGQNEIRTYVCGMSMQVHQKSQPELQFRCEVRSEVSSCEWFWNVGLGILVFESGPNSLGFNSGSVYFRRWGGEGPQELGSPGPGSMVLGTFLWHSSTE